MFQEDFTATRPAPEVLARPLLRWFDKHHRDLPWRHSADPYHVWVSEIMLQQTQVVTVIPYYERFLRAFPSIQTLADAPLDDVLRLWEGLGYYSRARNLHRAARIVADQHGGCFPQTWAEARKLPGIGQYTAGAILSIAYGVRLPALDGNALRVLSRVFWLPGGGRQGDEKRQIEAWGTEAVSTTKPGDYNQALMELGATVCTPKSPDCPKCPLGKRCLAAQRGKADAIPVIARAVSETVEMAAAVLWHGDRLLLAQRLPRGVWAGLWEFPNTVLHKRAQTAGDADSVPAQLRVYLAESFGLQATVAPVSFGLTHGVMNRRIRLSVCEGRVALDSLCIQEHAQARWVRLDELEDYALPAPHRKLITRLLGDSQKRLPLDRELDD